MKISEMSDETRLQVCMILIILKLLLSTLIEYAFTVPIV